MNGLWSIFATQAEAQAYANAEAERLPRGPNDTTLIWDVPRELIDGRWVVACFDGDCQPWGDDWILVTIDDPLA